MRVHPGPATHPAKYSERGFGFGIWMALLAAVFSKAIVIPGIALGDFFFGLALLPVLARGLRSWRFSRLCLPGWVLYLALLIGAAIVGGTWASAFSGMPFSWSEFSKSFAKLVFYGCGAVTLALYFRRRPADYARGVVLTILTVNSIIALYIYMAQLLKTNFGLEVPYTFFWFGLGGPSEFGSDLKPRMLLGVWLPKARGVFSEPASFGVFQTLGMALVFNRRPRVCGPWKLAVLIVPLLLTFSLSAYALLLTLAIIVAPKYLTKQMLLQKTIVIVVLLFVTVFLLTPLGPVETLSETIFMRAKGLVETFVDPLSESADRSGGVRILGSWKTAFSAIERSPVFGTGIGNLDVALSGVDLNLRYENLSRREAALFSILPVVLGSMGLIGFAFFCFLLVSLLARAPGAGFIFVVATFATGGFLVATFWVYYALLMSLTGHRARWRLKRVGLGSPAPAGLW